MLTRLGKLSLLSMAIILVLSACGGSPGTTQDGEGAEEDRHIILGLDPYDNVKPSVYISKHIMEAQGIDVEIQKGEIGVLWAALAEGEIDAFFDIWSPSISASYIEKYEGEFVIAGTMYGDAPIGVYVPSYMDEIDSIAQLNEMKAKFDGKLHTIDKGSGTDISTREMVDVYDLDYEVVNSSDSAMVAHARKAIRQEEAVVFIGYRPHTMFSKLDVKRLDDPKEFWQFDDVQIGVATDLEDRLPVAFTVLSNLELPIEEIERWMVELEDGADPDNLAEEWIANHPDKVEAWLGE